MSVKVLSERAFRSVADKAKARELIREAHRKTVLARGFQSAEPLNDPEDPTKYLVLTGWTSENDWNNWFRTFAASNLYREVESLTVKPTTYRILRSASHENQFPPPPPHRKRGIVVNLSYTTRPNRIIKEGHERAILRHKIKHGLIYLRDHHDHHSPHPPDAARVAALFRTRHIVDVWMADAPAMAELNAKYMHAHDGPTDVLTFPAAESPIPVDRQVPEMRCYIGAMILCPSYIERQFLSSPSSPAGSSFFSGNATLPDFFDHVLAHGLCHLIGYHHDNEVDRAKMKALEGQIMQHWTA